MGYMKKIMNCKPDLLRQRLLIFEIVRHGYHQRCCKSIFVLVTLKSKIIKSHDMFRDAYCRLTASTIRSVIHVLQCILKL